MPTLLSYKNDTKLKEKFVKEIKWHQDADKFIKGTYSDGTKGCAVGCSIKSLNKLNDTKIKADDHKAYEEYLGLPEWLARLEDTIFEGLPNKDAMRWPLKFSEAIPVGVDLEPIKWKFSAYLIRENIKRVKGLPSLDEDVRKQVIDASRQVLKVHNTAIKTGVWDESARSAAESAAWSAAWSAARSAESAARSAESAAWSAARSAESAAWSAARSAESAAESAAWSAAYKKHAQKLLKLLKEAK